MYIYYMYTLYSIPGTASCSISLLSTGLANTVSVGGCWDCRFVEEEEELFVCDDVAAVVVVVAGGGGGGSVDANSTPCSVNPRTRSEYSLDNLSLSLAFNSAIFCCNLLTLRNDASIIRLSSVTDNASIHTLSILCASSKTTMLSFSKFLEISPATYMYMCSSMIYGCRIIYTCKYTKKACTVCM